MFKTILYWTFIIVIGIFSVLFLIGMMADRRNRNQNTGPTFKGVGPKDGEEKVRTYIDPHETHSKPLNKDTAAGPAFEIPTMNHFLQAARSGDMPGGVKTSLAVFTSEGMQFSAQPYKDWAPEPYSKLPGPAGPFGAQTEISPPPMIRFMHVISGLDSIFEDAFSQTPPLMLERSFKLMRTKVCSHNTMTLKIC